MNRVLDKFNRDKFIRLNDLLISHPAPIKEKVHLRKFMADCGFSESEIDFYYDHMKKMQKGKS